MRLPIDSGDPESAPGDYGFFSFEGHGVFLSLLPYYAQTEEITIASWSRGFCEVQTLREVALIVYLIAPDYKVA